MEDVNDSLFEGERSVPLKDAEELRRDRDEDHEPVLPDDPPPGWAEP
jgi:hypothetical protein